MLDAKLDEDVTCGRRGGVRAQLRGGSGPAEGAPPGGGETVNLRYAQQQQQQQHDHQNDDGPEEDDPETTGAQSVARQDAHVEFQDSRKAPAQHQAPLKTSLANSPS